VDKAIAFTEGGFKMADKEKFKRFKKQLLRENEESMVRNPGEIW
jgi:hypothetical protein